ncbi:MAG: dihydrolipoyl dehydrogenase [Planctomycetota bacterium]|nr:dihydrolipoyl dehydrogenase [Planctomycetota bacterium]
MSTREFDIIVLGAGNSADVPRIAAAAGMRVALVEKGPLGGTCPNRGCIPSKLLLAHAEAANAVRNAHRFHVDAQLNGVDPDRILKDVMEYTDRFDDILEEDLHENVTLFRGHGAFEGDRTVRVGDDVLTAPKVVIATGSRPRRPDLGAPYWTSDEMFLAERAPKSIVIVGGGYIATELATFFQGVGIDTRLIVRHGKLLGAEDDEVRGVFTEGFTAHVPVSFFTEIVDAGYEEGVFHLKLRGAGGYEGECRTEALLYAIGRVPNADRIGLENTSIATNDRGFIAVNDSLETNVDGVYALGDVTGRHMFTHAASFEAVYLGEVLTGKRSGPLDYGPMPHAVFTDPEVAGVGATEQQLKADGVDYVAAAAPYSSATKGRAIKERHGLVKFMLDRGGKILGCHIVGAQASVLLHEVIAAMKWRNHISSITEMIHIHPSLPEIVKGAARKAAAALDA